MEDANAKVTNHLLRFLNPHYKVTFKSVGESDHKSPICHSLKCTCNGNFPGLIFDGCKVGCSPGPSNDDEEEGGGDEAVEDQDQEDQHIV